VVCLREGDAASHSGRPRRPATSWTQTPLMAHQFAGPSTTPMVGGGGGQDGTASTPPCWIWPMSVRRDQPRASKQLWFGIRQPGTGAESGRRPRCARSVNSVLHQTPSTPATSADDRSQGHACVRVEAPARGGGPVETRCAAAHPHERHRSCVGSLPYERGRVPPRAGGVGGERGGRRWPSGGPRSDVAGAGAQRCASDRHRTSRRPAPDSTAPRVVLLVPPVGQPVRGP